MKITKRIRDRAAMLCAISASTPEMAEAYIIVALNLRWSDEMRDAYDLAIAAWDQCQHLPRPLVDAEAEALLRSGWTPHEVRRYDDFKYRRKDWT